jgi:phage terminase large subunit-like protein
MESGSQSGWASADWVRREWQNLVCFSNPWRLETSTKVRVGGDKKFTQRFSTTFPALWTWISIDDKRVRSAPALKRIVVAIDPAVSSTETADETGIVVAGIATCTCRGKPELHGFILDDLSGKYSPNDWAEKAVSTYHKYGACRIIAEANNGGDLVEANIRTVDRRISYRSVHAAQGKLTRVEPVAALYEQGKVHHVGAHARLEEQLTIWDPIASTKSPDRLDALVWAISELLLQEVETTMEKWARVPY